MNTPYRYISFMSSREGILSFQVVQYSSPICTKHNLDEIMEEYLNDHRVNRDKEERSKIPVWNGDRGRFIDVGEVEKMIEERIFVFDGNINRWRYQRGTNG